MVADVEDLLQVQVGHPAAVLVAVAEPGEDGPGADGGADLESREGVPRQVAVEDVERTVVEDDRRAVVARERDEGGFG